MIVASGLAQAIIIFVCLSFILYMYGRNVKDIHLELILAAIISFIWVFFSGFYTYSDSNYVFLGLNIFTFISWTTGLVFLKELFELLPSEKLWFFGRWYIILPLYWVLLLGLEYVGYNYWSIQLSSQYAGFLNLPLLHLPLYGQLYYVLIGIVYLIITEILRIK